MFSIKTQRSSFEAASGLKPFPSQILKETLHLRLELVWSILLYKSFKKVFIWGWIRWIQLQKTSHQSIWLATLTWTTIWAVSIRNPIVKLECLLDPIVPAHIYIWSSNWSISQLLKYITNWWANLLFILLVGSWMYNLFNNMYLTNQLIS